MSISSSSGWKRERNNRKRAISSVLAFIRLTLLLIKQIEAHSYGADKAIVLQRLHTVARVVVEMIPFLCCCPSNKIAWAKIMDRLSGGRTRVISIDCTGKSSVSRLLL